MSICKNQEFKATVEKYVQLMAKENIKTIVNMNTYITENNLWDEFYIIRRLNTFEKGFKSIGISKEAYFAVSKLYITKDVVTSHLIHSKIIRQTSLALDY